MFSFNGREESKVNDEPEEQKSAVKLNAVVNLIDSVSSDMIYYKEKVFSCSLLFLNRHVKF